MDVARAMSWQEAVTKVRERLGIVANTTQSASMVTDILVTVNQAMWIAMGEDLLVDRFYLRVESDGTFWAPPGYGSLDAVNIEGAPQPIRDKFYEFHQNGPGSVGTFHKPQTSKIGTYASMMGHADHYTLGVMAAFPETDARVVVEGVDRGGNAVNSFLMTGPGTTRQHPGVLFEPNGNMVINSSILWKSITRIRKNATKGPISVWAFPNGEKSEGMCVAPIAASSEGNILFTKYNMGALPECCQWPTIEGRLRLEYPTGASEHVWVPSVRALVSLASAAHESLKPGGDAVAKDAALRMAAEIAAADFRSANPGQQGRIEVDTNISPTEFYARV